jgi:hypothetical protein
MRPINRASSRKCRPNAPLVFRRPSYGKLQIEITVDGSKAYTKPWTVTLTHSIVFDTDLRDYICMENEKSAPHLVGK